MAPQTIGETARRQLLSQLQEHYRDYSVSVRRGHFDPNLGLVFEDLRIADTSRSTLQFRSREMVRIERLTVIGDIHPQKLLEQQNPMITRRVLLEGVTANTWVQADGNLSLTSLLPLPTFGPAVPRMELQNVRVRLLGTEAKSRPVDLELAEVVLVNTPNKRGIINKEITIRGSADFANDLFAKIELNEGSTDVRCAASGIHLNRSLFDRLPESWSQSLEHAKDLTCVCDATLSLHQSAAGKLNYQVRTTVHDGRFAHPLLPQVISQVRGVAVCDPSGVSIEASQAALGDAVLRVTGRIDGYQWPCDMNLNVTTRGLLLDDRVAAALPSSMLTQWEKLQPLGRVDIDAKLVHQQRVWKTDADLICKGVDIRYEKFPYPVEQLVGRIEVRDGIVSADALSGRVAGNRMQCAFRLPIGPGITNEKSFVVATDGPVPIDKTLLNSLSPRGQPTTSLESFIRSLRPRGSVRLATAVFATDANGRQTRKLDLRVIDGHMRYENFAYPLYNVSGKVQVENELVKLIGFRGTNANAGIILCDGGYQMPVKDSAPAAHRISDLGITSQTESLLALSLRASNVPMDESLRSSLPASTQHVWDVLSPSGVLDELNVILGQHGKGNPLTMDVTAKQNDHGQVTNRLLSLRPSSLPYRLDVTGGSVRFDGSQVTIESIKGRHDGSKLSADGTCVQGVDGRWELALNLHSGSRLHPDAELIAALPSQMREAMRRLQLRGPVNVRGTTRLTMPDTTHPEPVVDWDLVLQLEDNRIGDVGPSHSIRGELSVEGMRDESVLRAEGHVQIDSMHVHDLQLTGIRGPFSIDGDRLYLGGKSSDRKLRASSDRTHTSPSIRGKLFDGTIDLDGEVVLSSGSFDVGLVVRNAQVPTLLADFGQGKSDITGVFSGQAQLQGNLGTSDLLKGSGAARVTGANLYQLPLIIQMFNLLRVTPNEDVAFTDGQVEFAIFGDTVTFSDLQIWGDLVSLQGGGTLDRRRELDLTFNTRVSPQNTFSRVIRPLRSQRYTLWTIDVRGPLNALQIERKAMDGVGETLERLFPVMTGSKSDQPADELKSTRGFGSWFR